MPDGDRGEALVHRRMLTGTKQRDNYLRCGGGDNADAEGDRVDCCRGLERGPWGEGGMGKERIYHGRGGDGRLG